MKNIFKSISSIFRKDSIIYKRGSSEVEKISHNPPIINIIGVFNPLSILIDNNNPCLTRGAAEKIRVNDTVFHASCCSNKAARIYFDIVCYDQEDADSFVSDFDYYKANQSSTFGVYEVVSSDEVHYIQGYLYIHDINVWISNIFKTGDAVMIQKENKMFYRLVNAANKYLISSDMISQVPYHFQSILSDSFFRSWNDYILEIRFDSKFVFSGFGVKQYFNEVNIMTEQELHRLSNLTVTIVTAYSTLINYALRSVSDEQSESNLIYICDFDYDGLMSLRKRVSESTMPNRVVYLKEIDHVIRLLTSLSS